MATGTTTEACRCNSLGKTYCPTHGGQGQAEEHGAFVEKVGEFLEELGMNKEGATHPSPDVNSDAIIKRFADWYYAQVAEG